MADSKSGFGHFKPYGSVDIDMYLNRFTSYLFTRDVVEPDPLAEGADAAARETFRKETTAYQTKRKRWLLAEIGPEAYAVLDGLCGAAAPESKSALELEGLLKTHFKPRRNKNTEREKFYSRKQGQNESVSEFSVALYQLSKFCEFGEFLDQALQTQFINNLKSVKLRERVAEGKPTFSEVIAEATKFEQVFESAAAQPSAAIHKVQKSKHPESKKSSSKEGEKKKPDKKKKGYDLSKVRCYNCNNLGHFANKCPEPKKPKKEKEKKEVKVVLLDNEVDPRCFDLYPVWSAKSDRVYIRVKLDGVPIDMEVDTAAKAATIDNRVYAKYFSHIPLRPTATLVWGSPLPMLGEIDVKVEYNGEEKVLPLSVVDKPFPLLYGLPWIREIRPDFDSLFPASKKVFPVCQNVDEQQLISDLRRKYPTVFGGGSAPIKGFEVSLILKEGAKPVFRGPRNIAIPLREPTRKALDDMEQAQYIEACEPGPWGTPIVPVRKKDSEVRVCGDFSVTLNNYLEVTGRALPLIDDLSTVKGSYFCILDMKMAYLQLKLDPASQDLCKLSTPFGTYKCLRMPFGIASAPNAFQEVISSILAGIENCFKYLDDILLWGETLEDCQQVLHQILTRMEKYHVKLNLNKCKFLQLSVIYLGFQLDKFGSRPDPNRMDELLKKPIPKDHSQLSSFVGMITFFHKYGENLATVLHPLYQLKKSSTFYWGKREQAAYDKALKLLSTTVLVPYSLDRPLRLTSDASPVGAGCVLSHVTPDGKEEPIAFASKMFSKAELNYPVHEKEGAAMVFGLKHFDKYVTGREFQIVSDNKALVAIFSEKSHQRPLAAARLQRWQLLLSAHQYTIIHRKSEQIAHADYLSRFPSQNDEPVESDIYWVSQIPGELVSAIDVAEGTMTDPVLKKVLQHVMQGWPDQCPDEVLKPFHKIRLELSAENNVVLWGGRVIIPDVLQPQVLELLHETHPGGSRMKSLARSYVWWPNMDQHIEDFVKSCEVCQALMTSVPHDSYVPWSWPTRRWQRLHMDFGCFQGVELLVVLDAHSKWPEVRIMSNTKCQTVIEALRSMFAAFGLPEEIVSDNGQPFASQEMSQFLQANGIVQKFSPTYHPQSNGAAENEVKTVKRSLLKQLVDKKTEDRSLTHKIDAFLFTYRNTPHTVTKISPAELFLGRRPRTPLTLLQPGNVLKMKMKVQQDKRQSDERLKISRFVPGDFVWVRNLEHGKIKWLPGLIESVVSSVSYMVQVNKRVRQVSSSHLRVRSPRAATIEDDPTALVQPEILPEGLSPEAIPVPVAPDAVPVVPESVVEPPPVTPPQSKTPGGLPKQPAVPVTEPMPVTPQRPSPARRAQRVITQPTVQPPVAEPMFTRRGRAVVPPKRLDL